jgi:ferredoxin
VQANGAWAIDDAACIRCHACKDIAPDDIVIEDKYRDVIPLRTLVSADVARSG